MKKLLTSLLMFCLTYTVQSQINLLNGLRAQYDFSGNANDVSGNGFNGTVNGATLTNDRFGNPNSAYYFNGVNQNIEVQGFQNMITGNDVSVSIWMKADQVKVQSIMMLTPDIITDRFNIAVYYSHNGVSSTFWDYGNYMSGGRLGSINTFFQSVWEHYVFIASSTQNLMQVYRNGYLILQKSGMSDLINKSKVLNIGGAIGDNGTVNHFFSGTLDDIRIYDRVLNPLEIMALYNGYYESNVKDLRVFITNWPNPRPGFNEELYLICQNVGTTTANGYVEINYDPMYQFINASATPDSVNTAASYLSFNFTNLTPGSQKVFSLNMNLPSTVPLGTPLVSTAVIYPVTGDTVPSDNYDTLHQTVVNGYDPNDMLVSPAGDVYKSYVENGNWFIYTIRFQNTGNASAINVRVENQLESDFYISSLSIIGSSHNFTWSLSNSNKLTFYFNNINLPDSGTNFMGSNGFIMYRIKGLPWLNAGDQLTNNANIFFDFNQPVLTNTVTTTILAPSEVINNEPIKDDDVFVYPNPFTHHLQLLVPKNSAAQIEITISNLNGKTVYARTHQVAGNRLIEIETSSLQNGFYLLKAKSGSSVSYQKIIRMD
jgi:uncharacterized repeat protein (TIGR01451 family)